MTGHVEGSACVLAALEARQRRISVILLDRAAHPSRVSEIAGCAEERGIPVRLVERRELEQMTHGRSHGGVAAVCGPKPLMAPGALMESLHNGGAAPFLLLLEGVDDGRNLGYTLRTADALGVGAVLIKKHLWDFDTTQVSRASSGAYERLPLVKFEGTDLLRRLRKEGVHLWGCLGGAKRSLEAVDLTGAVAMAIGGEKRGLSGATRKLCDGFVRIPTRERAASLALSQAAAIVMAEVARQRRRVS